MLLNLINVVPETNTVRRVQKRLFRVGGSWLSVAAVGVDACFVVGLDFALFLLGLQCRGFGA